MLIIVLNSILTKGLSAEELELGILVSQSCLIHSHQEILPMSKTDRLRLMNMPENETHITIKNCDTPVIKKIGAFRIFLDHWQVLKNSV